MGALLYIRLIGYTAGTLLQLFWMVVILGYRRQRNFERVFFFLCLALFLFYGGSLLAVNAQLYYVHPSPALLSAAWLLLCLGLVPLPSLLLHLHAEYSDMRQQLRNRSHKHLLLVVAYLPLAYITFHLYQGAIGGLKFNFIAPITSLGWPY